MRIKKGDNVMVLSGNDKGKTGEVLEVMPKEDKVVVKGVNIRKKHVKARRQGEESGIIPVECSIPVSKVNVVCPKCGKATKVGYSIEKDGKVTFLHKVKNGAVDKSYGIHVASLAHLPDSLIKRADEILNIYEKKNIKKETFTQTSLFELTESEAEPKKNEMEEKIKEINPLEMTPMEALNYLYELKKEVNRKE